MIIEYIVPLNCIDVIEENIDLVLMYTSIPPHWCYTMKRSERAMYVGE
jgi:hypothetical protein